MQQTLFNKSNHFPKSTNFADKISHLLKWAGQVGPVRWPPNPHSSPKFCLRQSSFRNVYTKPAHINADLCERTRKRVLFA